MDDHLTHWVAAAPTPSGFFIEKIARDWTPNTRAAEVNVVAQSRLVYIFARCATLPFALAALRERCRAAATSGAEFVLRHFVDATHGGVFWSVGSSGRVRDDHKDAYGHAFALLALTHAFTLTADDRYRAAAAAVWRSVRERMRDERACAALQRAHAGLSPCLALWQSMPRDWSSPHGRRPDATSRSQNPLMHTFEALLALYGATRDAALLGDIGALARLATSVLFQREGAACGDERPSPEHSCAEQAKWGKCGQSWMRGFCCQSCGHHAAATAAGQGLRGYVAETLDEDWRPQPSSPIAIGHQYEWATLLSLAAELGALPAPVDDFMAVARQLLETGLRIGYDEQHGGVFYWADSSGSVVKSPWDSTSPQRKEYWVQAEVLRAFSRFAGPLTSDGLPLYGASSPEAKGVRADGSASTDLWPRFTQTLAFVRESLADSRYGGWFQYDDPGTSRNHRPLEKGNEWKSGYHVVTAHLEVLRWCESDS